MTLVKQKVMPTRTNPKRLVIYGKPKIGKTTLLSKLPDCLILDFEYGSEHVEAYKVNIIGLKPSGRESAERVKARQEDNKWYLTELIREIRKQIKESGKAPYKFVAADTITELEEMCVMHATEMYMNTVQGKKFNRDNSGNDLPKVEWESVLTLANGAGYRWLRESFGYWLNEIDKLAPNIILVGHVKDKMVNKLGKETLSSDLDLTGKIAGITAAKSDAIGYVYRKGDSTYINFASKDEACGTRCEHLIGREIALMEIENGEIIANWDQIYID